MYHEEVLEKLIEFIEMGQIKATSPISFKVLYNGQQNLKNFTYFSKDVVKWWLPVVPKSIDSQVRSSPF